MNEKVIQLLDGTKKLLVEKGWTQGARARSAEGGLVPPGDPRACSFCLLGAFARTCEESSVDSSNGRLRALLALWTAKATAKGIAAYNDEAGRTKEDILALIDRAKDLVVNGQV